MDNGFAEGYAVGQGNANNNGWGNAWGGDWIWVILLLALFNGDCGGRRGGDCGGRAVSARSCALRGKPALLLA